MQQLERIVNFVFQNSGSITTAKRISDYFKLQKLQASVDTVINYLDFIKESFLVYQASRFDIKGKRFLELFEKYYPSDTGLRHGMLGYRESDIGGVLENIVYLELKRRGYAVSVGTFDGLEIDFIAQKQDEKIYIQVCYLLADQSVVEREFGNLEKIADNYPKYVLSMDEIDGGNRNGIQRIHIIDFLLQDS